MASFVKKLRQKPDDVKNRIAIITAVSVTLIIVLIWMLVLKNKNSDDDIKKRSMRDDLRPLMIIFGGAKEDLNKIRENVKTNE
jgi:hypothetical protein